MGKKDTNPLWIQIASLILVFIPALILAISSYTATNIQRQVVSATMTASSNLASPSAMPASTQLALQITPSPTPALAGFPSSNWLVPLSSLLAVIITVLLYFFYRKYANNTATGINAKHIESYLEQRAQLRIIRADNDSTLAQNNSLEKEIETRKEKALLEGIIPFLKIMLINGAKDVHCEEIVTIFTELRITETEEVISGLLHRPNTDLQIACVTALGEFRTTSGKNIIKKILHQPGKWDTNVINRSISAIKKIRPPDYFEILVELLHHNDVSEQTKKSYIIPALDQINTDKAKNYIKAYEISRLEGERLDEVLRRLTA